MLSFATRKVGGGSAIRIAVAMKWAARRVEVDPHTGGVRVDERLSGASDADLAALECGLRFAEAWNGELVVASAGPPQCERLLRLALASGAHRVMRCPLRTEVTSEAVAVALAKAFVGSDLVICGDRSIDRGSGAVPAYLAAYLGAAQALGLVSLRSEGRGIVQGERRLDGGRRERLRVGIPAVVSVEGSVARLRRASLCRLLDAEQWPIEQLPPPVEILTASPPAVLSPFSPRPRELPLPDPQLSARERLLAVTAMLSERRRARTMVLGPAEAARLMLDQLREWGYVK